MKCPKCGYHRQIKDNPFVPQNECPACGILYGKHAEATLFPKIGSESSGPIRNPSPVSASSLKKARERVDRRLRKKQLEQVRDVRHTQTLELARRLTAEGVRQRQAEWKKRNQEETSPTAQTEAHADHPKQTGVLSAPPRDEIEAKPKTKQPTGAIAMALDKKEKEPRKGMEKTTPPAPIQLYQNRPDALDSSTKPPSLKEMLKDLDPPIPKKRAAAKPRNPFHLLTAGGWTSLLPLVAWLILGAGVIGAILSWTTLGNVQAGMQTPAASASSTLPLGLLLGFAYLATGVLGFAFFWVSSLINLQLKDIRRLLLLQSAPKVEPKQV